MAVSSAHEDCCERIPWRNNALFSLVLHRKLIRGTAAGVETPRH
jgi:hypothetical protein